MNKNSLYDSYIKAFIGLVTNAGWFDGEAQSFFVTYSSGVQTNRDAWFYNFSRTALATNIQKTIDYYNKHEPKEVEPTKINWTQAMKNKRRRGRELTFNTAKIVEAVYRPLCKQNLYYGKALIEMMLSMPKFFPTDGEDNLLICVNSVGDKKLSVMMTDRVTDEQIQFNGQCKLKMNDSSSEKNEVQKAKSQFVVSSSNVPIILDSLKESLNNVALLIEVGVEVVLNLEIAFVRNTSNGSMLLEIITNMLATIGFISEDFLADKIEIAE